MTTRLKWMKSPYSGADGCVEIAASCESGNCVVVSENAGDVLIRDSKLGEAGPVLRFTMAEWRAFVDGIAGIDGRLQETIGVRE